MPETEDADRPAGPKSGSRPEHGRRRRVLTAVALLTAAVGATAAAAYGVLQPARGASDPAGAAPLAAPTTEGSLDLRDLTPAEEDLLHSAEQLLLRDCMRAKGFVYQPVARQPVPEAREFPYVIDDVEWARRHGYGRDIERRLEEIRTEDPNQHYFESLPADRKAPAIAAANGPRAEGLTARTPDGMPITRSPEGCTSQGQRTLYLDLAAWFQARVTMDSLASLRGEKVTADRELAGPTRGWAACMRAAGHDYADPAALRAAQPPRSQAWPREQETALAVAEAECAESSGLAVTAGRLDRKYDAELRQQYRSDAETWQRLRLAALPRARSVVAADPGH
ncbi:hypothetical protein [Streptomyces sp. CBMA156]|uniref:hypothetical protein n=1 Tax=Streptomyces sp. CBMA156 TaxID=1930280 RepID=UPI001CB843DE|nr:hypothetical protein [Streptomyces sp. CBMA156]